jgi:hypothetical protein
MLISFDTLLLVGGLVLGVSSEEFFLALKERLRRMGWHLVRYDLMGERADMVVV